MTNDFDTLASVKQLVVGGPYLLLRQLAGGKELHSGLIQSRLLNGNGWFAVVENWKGDCRPGNQCLATTGVFLVTQIETDLREASCSGQTEFRFNLSYRFKCGCDIEPSKRRQFKKFLFLLRYVPQRRKLTDGQP